MNINFWGVISKILGCTLFAAFISFMVFGISVKSNPGGEAWRVGHREVGFKVTYLSMGGVTAGCILAIAIRAMSIACFFRHRRRYVSIYDKKFYSGQACDVRAFYIHWHWSDTTFQVARWVCDREGCLGHGEICLGEYEKGIYTIHQGKVIIDEKRWANRG